MSSRLHIANFTNTYTPNINGVAKSVSRFRKALTEEGHNAFVFAPEVKRYKDKEPFIFRYPSLALPDGRDYSLTIPVSPLIDGVIPRLKLDIIHSHHPVLLGSVAARKAKRLKLPLVFTFHTQYDAYSSFLPIKKDLSKKVVDRWLLNYLSKCSHIIVPSQSILKKLHDYGLSDKVSVIATGVDTRFYPAVSKQQARQLLNWNPSDLYLISMGRLAVEKNWLCLLKSIEVVKNSHSKVKLVILGDGVYKKELKQWCRHHKIYSNITWVSTSVEEILRLYLRAADIFCYSSVTETQGLVTTEAIAAGLPVVAVDAPGTHDIVTCGKESLLTPNNPLELAAAICKLLDDSVLRYSFSQAALKRAQAFDIQLMSEKLIEVYREVIESHKNEKRNLKQE